MVLAALASVEARYVRIDIKLESIVEIIHMR
jgi:hypothetical protein